MQTELLQDFKNAREAGSTRITVAMAISLSFATCLFERIPEFCFALVCSVLEVLPQSSWSFLMHLILFHLLDIRH